MRSDRGRNAGVQRSPSRCSLNVVLILGALTSAALILGFIPTTSVYAHAEPVRVMPGDGAVLTSAPTTIEMEMSQEMARRAGANDIDVLDADGQEITAVSAVIDNSNRRRLSVPLPSDLSPGTYTVRWKTLSAEDGDSETGETTFTFDPDATPSTGQEVLREDLLQDEPTVAGGGQDDSPAARLPGNGDDGLSWVTVAVAAVAAFVLGSGGTFLLIQKRP